MDVVRGLYQLEGRSLKATMYGPERPTSFSEADIWVFEWKGRAVNLSPLDTGYVSGLVTWNYWIGLAGRLKKLEPLSSATKTTGSPDGMRANLIQLGEGMNQARSGIAGLPLLNVDPEATGYAAQIVEVLGEGESLLGDVAGLISEAQRLDENANSLGAGLEAFIRGVFGDPLGKYHETNAQLRQIDVRRLTLSDRWKAYELKSNRADAQELTVRASLSQRYHREFPKLD